MIIPNWLALLLISLFNYDPNASSSLKEYPDLTTSQQEINNVPTITPVEFAIFRRKYDKSLDLVKREFPVRPKTLELLQTMYQLEIKGSKEQKDAQITLDFLMKHFAEKPGLRVGNQYLQKALEKAQTEQEKLEIARKQQEDLEKARQQYLKQTQELTTYLNSNTFKLSQAIIQGDLAEVKELLRYSDVDPNDRINNITPVDLAIAQGNFKALAHLWYAGGKVTPEHLKAADFCLWLFKNAVEESCMAIEGSRIPDYVYPGQDQNDGMDREFTQRENVILLIRKILENNGNPLHLPFLKAEFVEIDITDPAPKPHTPTPNPPNLPKKKPNR